MSHSKVSVLFLGGGDYLKKALITSIVGNDLPKLSEINNLKNTEIYENDTYRAMCTPDTACEDIKELFATSPHPDVSLLVVEKGFSAEEVWMQIEKLSSMTGRPTKKFRVVLPFSYKQTEPYPFQHYTTEELFSKLKKLAEERCLKSAKRHAGDPESDISTPHTPMEITGEHSGTKVNLVLLGKSGTGKSASGNTILSRTLFKSSLSSGPVTTECKEAEGVIGRRRVRVIDTPDIFDDEVKSSIKNKHVKECKKLCQQEPCVYLLVMRASRFTEDEKKNLEKMEKAFGKKVQKQTVVLFTRGEDLKRDEITFENFLKQCQSDLKEIVEKCDNRCVLFENSDSGSDQVEKLMQTVDRML